MLVTVDALKKHDQRVADGQVHFVSYAMVSSLSGSVTVMSIEVDPPKRKYLIGAMILNLVCAAANITILGWKIWTTYS